jgi:hypothetical protein
MTALSVRGLSVLLIPSKPGADEDNVNPFFEVLRDLSYTPPNALIHGFQDQRLEYSHSFVSENIFESLNSLPATCVPAKTSEMLAGFTKQG